MATELDTAPIIDTQPGASEPQVTDGSVELSAQEQPTLKQIVMVRPIPKSVNRKRGAKHHDMNEANDDLPDASTDHGQHHRAETPTAFADEDDVGVNLKKLKNRERKPSLLQRVRALLMPKSSKSDKDDMMRDIGSSSYVVVAVDTHVAIDSAKNQEAPVNIAPDHLDVSPAVEQYTANNNLEETERDVNDHRDGGDENKAPDDEAKVVHRDGQLTDDGGIVHGVE